MTGGQTEGLLRTRHRLGSSVVPLKPAAAGGTAALMPGHQGTPATVMSPERGRLGTELLDVKSSEKIYM